MPDFETENPNDYIPLTKIVPPIFLTDAQKEALAQLTPTTTTAVGMSLKSLKVILMKKKPLTH